MITRVVIFGAWYLGEVAAETVDALGWEVAGYVDPEPMPGVSTLGHVPDGAACFVAIGDNRLREQVTARLVEKSRPIASLVHPTAWVSASVRLGRGCYVGEHAVIRAAAQVGDGALINAGAIVSHHARLGHFVTCGPNAAIGSRCKVGDRTLVGIGACLRPGTVIGSDCVLGAGTVAMGRIASRETVIGNPGRIMSCDAVRRPPGQSDWASNTIW